jgi:serine/threonine protein kinase
MELLEGHSLHDEMTRVGRFAARAAAEIVTRCARPWPKAHAAGIVHRDIARERVPATQPPRRDGEGAGLRHREDGGRGCPGREPHRGWGHPRHPAYMAPERFRGEAIDGASTSTAWGDALSDARGAARFPGFRADGRRRCTSTASRPLPEVDPAIAPEIERIVLSALRKDPRQRPDIGTFASELRARGRAQRRDGRHGGDRPPRPT